MKNNPIVRQRGSIPLVMVLVLALAVAIIGVTSYVNTSVRFEAQAEAEVRASRAAETALEIDMANMKQMTDSIRPAVPGIAEITNVCNLSKVPSDLFPSSAGYHFTRNIAVPVEDGLPVAAFASNGSSNATKTYHYVCEATVTYTPVNSPPVSVTMQRAFVHHVVPLFQYAIFFGGQSLPTVTGNGDLELNPGQNFTVGGRVHSNRNLYYGSNATLTFQGAVTSVASVAQNNSSPNDTAAHAGNWGNAATVFANGTPRIMPYQVAYIPFPCSTVGGVTNQTGPQEFVMMPVSGVADPNSKDREYSIAGLKILVNTGTSWVYLPDGTTRLYPRAISSTAGATDANPCAGTGHTIASTDSCGFAILTKDGTLVPWLKQSSATGTYNDLYQLLANTISPTQPGFDSNFPWLPNSIASIAWLGGASGRPILRFSRQTQDASGYDKVHDFRQVYSSGGRWMTCVSLDVSKLARAVDTPLTTDASTVTGVTLPSGDIAKIDLTVPNSTDYGLAAGKTLWNGVVSIHDIASTTETAANTKGVMLVDGQTLPTTVESTVAPGGGLTVVTDGSLYIIGDYNTGGMGTAVPTNNSGTSPTVTATPAYTVRPAAVMADAVNVLSGLWSPAYNMIAANSPSTRPAISTTYNTAILSGNVPSVSTVAYSGGVENFPRLLEDWGNGKVLTFYGSMVCLFASQYATSPWQGGYYGVPSRNWFFEPSFNDPNRLPPGTPNSITLTNGEWVRGIFDSNGDLMPN